MAPGNGSEKSPSVLDKLSRRLTSLRVSITDRCNFRCFFCMPVGSQISFLPRSEILSYEEVSLFVRAVARLGVEKVRITGGEPLIRSGVERLISMVSPYVRDIALTTNGYMLREKARSLKESGLRRLTVSLSTLKEERFRSMAGGRFSLRRVLEGIEEALTAGFEEVKLNAVIVRGFNEDEILDIARFGREMGVWVRFIEFMDVGTLNSWDVGLVVPMDEILEALEGHYSFRAVGRRYGGTSYDFVYEDMDLGFGIIASVSRPFCGDCSRLRLSADGKLYTCLFSTKGHDVKALLRSGANEELIADRIRSIWEAREDRYSELRGEIGLTEVRNRVEMFRVGG